MLAARIGMTDGAITLIEQGKRQNPGTIKKIAKALGVSMRQLMTDEAREKTA